MFPLVQSPGFGSIAAFQVCVWEIDNLYTILNPIICNFSCKLFIEAWLDIIHKFLVFLERSSTVFSFFVRFVFKLLKNVESKAKLENLLLKFSWIWAKAIKMRLFYSNPSFKRYYSFHTVIRMKVYSYLHLMDISDPVCPANSPIE